MRVLITAFILALALILTGCGEEERHFIGKEEVGTFISSEGIHNEYGHPRAKIVTTEGIFYVSSLMSARNGEKVWIEEYSDRQKYMCAASNNMCYGLVAN